MDAAGHTTQPESFSVWQSAKEGFKAIKKRPLTLLGMAIAVNLPVVLYVMLVKTVLKQPLCVWGPGLPIITQSLVSNHVSVAALVLMLLALLWVRPLWIRICLNLCGTDTPRPNRRTYINFAAASILQFLVIVVIGLVTSLCMSVTRDYIQAIFITAGLLVVAIVLLHLMFFPYLIVSRGSGAVESIKESIRLTRGIIQPLFGWGAVFILCATILNRLPFGAVLTDFCFGTTTAMVYMRRQEFVK